MGRAARIRSASGRIEARGREPTMGTSVVRIGIAGCGQAARIHLDRLLAEEGVAIVGCADPNLEAARALADRAAVGPAIGPGARIRRSSRAAPPDGPRCPGDLQPAPDALPAGHGCTPGRLPCLHREAAVDQPPGGGRYRRPGPRARLEGRGRPSVPARSQPGRGASAAGGGGHRPGPAGLGHPHPPLARPRSARPRAPGGSTRSRPAGASSRTSATTWSTPCSGPPARSAHEVGAVQSRREPDIDLVTAAAIRLADGTPATLAISGVSPGPLFVTRILRRARPAPRHRRRPWRRSGRAPPARMSPCPRPPAPSTATSSPPCRGQAPLCCPADQALDTVRLLEAIARSAATRQVVRLV